MTQSNPSPQPGNRTPNQSEYMRLIAFAALILLITGLLFGVIIGALWAAAMDFSIGIAPYNVQLAQLAQFA